MVICLVEYQKSISPSKISLILCAVFMISPPDIGPMAFCRKRHRLWDMNQIFKQNTVSNLKICIFGDRVSVWRLGTAYSCVVSVSSGHTEGKLKSWSMTTMTTTAHHVDLRLTLVKTSPHSFSFTAPEMVNTHNLLY